MELQWLGHGTWSLVVGDSTILLDPFLDENPAAPCRAAEVEADFILVSHGHFDHVSDVATIAQRTGAQVLATYEIAEWFAKHHDLQATVGMNLGGGLELPFGRVSMTLAHHSSSLPDGSYGGNPAGFLIESEDKTIYFACDTALFGDMKLIGERGIDLAVLPIGDLFTMGPRDSVLATRLIRPKRVAPAHYNTWPPIEQDTDSWAAQIKSETDADPIVIRPGEKFSL